MIELGLDIGYSSTKAVFDRGSFKVPSVVGTYEEWFAVNASRKVIKLDGQKYLVGSDAIDQSQIVERREDRAWIRSDMYSRLLKFALINTAQMEALETTSMFVVSGLPLAYFNKDAEFLKQLFIGEHRGEMDGVTSIVTVNDARIVPQPFGALLNHALTTDGGIIPENASGRVGVIDVGGKTTNILSVKDLAEQSREATSVSVGGWTAVRKLRDFLVDQYPEVDDRASNIERILVNGSFVYYGERIGVSDAISRITKNIASQIEAELSQRWGGGSHFEKILISGGGANLVGNSIIEVLPQAFIVKDPVFANAKGFHKFAKRSS